ncbi:hypothetical protein HUJ04_009698 [Dendroctonus ponderosae]|nr:hypothetical protein HUJ04_009698 [Dendroctonus ponderosae]KAH1019957.1 hypothetical protein HUJ04_009698 [Dendroctonus ponderosae]
MDDKRFLHVKKDPKFRKVPKSESKVKIDGRFQSMFTDKQFQSNYTSDKRGRPVKLRSKEDLKRFYEVSSEEESASESDSEAPEPGKHVRARSSASSEDEAPQPNKLDVKDKKLPVDVKEKLRDLQVDYARGEKCLYSDSSSDDEETDQEVSDSEDIDHKWGELDADAGTTEEATHRLAACNLDWDRIRAIDLMVLFNSFLPPSGAIKSVVIYPSEYGKQRLKEEEVKGPIELVDADPHPEPEEDENEEGSKYHMEKLRQYQLNCLKYYYAVITVNNANSANKIYTECDGMEYESSTTKIDLRFIPDEMTFDDETKDSCDQLPTKYQPRFFTTTALQQAKVELTWDETNPDRLEISEKINSGKLDDISEKELENYLAASSDEDESSDESEEDSQQGSSIDKYKALLEGIQDKEQEKKNKDFEMEISWGVSLKKKTDKLIKEKQISKEDKTPFQKYLDKKKEKRKERKKKAKAEQSEDSDMPSDIDMNDPYFAEEFNNPEFKTTKKLNKKNRKQAVDEDDKQKQAELDLILMSDGDDAEEKKHFNFNRMLDKGKNKKKKGKKRNEEQQNEDDFKVNLEDKRFSARFTSYHYNVDPSDPRFKQIKRKNDICTSNEAKKAKSAPGQKNVELNSLIKNVKRKTQAFRSK